MIAADPSAVATGPNPPPAAEAETTRGAARRLGVYIELTKPGIVRMVLITAAAGFFMASGLGHPINLLLLLHTLFGMGLVASGSCALNEYVEHEADARMRRTAGRPIPSGRMTPATALRFSWFLSLLGTVHLVAFVNLMTAVIVATTLISYVFIYTPLKRQHWTATLVGAVPGALPILAGWVAGGGGMSAPGLALFGILFLWQMPHFYALAWMYRDDYERGGFRMITLEDPTGKRTAAQVLLFTTALYGVSLAPTVLGLSGMIYLVSAIILGTMFFVLAINMAVHRDHRRAVRLFLGSVVYLPLLLLMMAVDRLVG